MKIEQEKLVLHLGNLLKQGQPCEPTVIERFVKTLDCGRDGLIDGKIMMAILKPLVSIVTDLNTRTKDNFKKFSADGKTPVFTPESSL